VRSRKRDASETLSGAFVGARQEDAPRVLWTPRATGHARRAAEAPGFDPLAGACRPGVGQAGREESGEGVGSRGHDARTWAAGPPGVVSVFAA
jgi:hypothetical protein